MTDNTFAAHPSDKGSALIVLAWIAFSIGAYLLVQGGFSFEVENPFRPLIGYAALLGFSAIASPFCNICRLFFLLVAVAGVALAMLAMGVFFISLTVEVWNFQKSF